MMKQTMMLATFVLGTVVAALGVLFAGVWLAGGVGGAIALAVVLYMTFAAAKLMTDWLCANS